MNSVADIVDGTSLVQKVSDGSLNSWIEVSQDEVLKIVMKFSNSKSPLTSILYVSSPALLKGIIIEGIL